VMGPDHPFTLGLLNNWGSCLRDLKRYDQAEPVLRDAVERVRRVLGEDHPNTLTIRLNHANLLGKLNQLPQAEKILRDVEARWHTLAGPDHPMSIRATAKLADNLSKQGRFEEAVALLRDVVERALAAPDLGPAHRDTLYFARSLAEDLDQLHQYDEARTVRARFKLPAPSTQQTGSTQSSTRPSQ
jgi:tetratricopeptide (TPR) repeat protein